MANIRDRILAAQAVAVRYWQAKMAGLSGADALNELALMIAADGYTTRSPLTSMCFRYVEKRNNDSQWGESEHLAEMLAATLFDQFSESPSTWDPVKASIYTWFRRNLGWRWSDLCKKEFRIQKGRVRDAQDPETGETVDRLTLVAGRSDHGEAWESETVDKVESMVRNELPENQRTVATECWMNSHDPKPQKQIARELEVAESTINLWKKQAQEKVVDCVYNSPL
jgi:DNA-directed RNA polymerase specialized sigma24 family protein